VAAERPIDDLRSEALDAAQGLLDGEQALAGALRAIREDSERAAEAYRAVVASLATALAARDGYTGAHSDIVHDLAVAVAARLGIDRHLVAEVEAVALLHDIGKIGVPDEVLHKRGPLDDREWRLMREHPVIGERILRPLPGLSDVATAVRHEHERWDGDGYPDGLAGEEIPLASRIVLACDTWSALVSTRPYRAALGVAEAREELRRHAGTQFDPDVVQALLESIDEQGRVRGADAPAAEVSALVDEEAGDREAQRLEREVHALITVVSAVAAVESLDDLVEVAADEACAALAATSVSISRWEADARVLRVIVNAGELADWEERRPMDELYQLESDDKLRLLLLEGRSYVTSLADPDALAQERELLRSLGRHSCAAVPVMLGGEAWGEIWASRDATLPVFSERDLRFLQTIAGQVAAAVGRTELFARMADLAFRDPLTGVGNRRALEERLELAVHECIEAGADLAVLLCDADNLKDLNDANGHQAGDAALRRLAQALVEEAPGSDPLVYRLGGDEFCILLPGVTAEHALELGERLLTALQAQQQPALTASCGIATLGMGVTRPTDLLRAADTAQYAAKRGGRRRVCLADPRPAVDWRRREPGAAKQRRLRDGLPSADVAALLAETVAALDGPLARAAVSHRLEDLASRTIDALDAARAAISFCATGGGKLDVVFMIDARTGRAWRRELGAAEDVWLVGDYPSTAAILLGGSFVAHLDDPHSDEAEKVVLREFGMHAVLASAAHDPHGSWLLEVYADERTLPLEPLEPAVRLLVAEAVRGSRRSLAPAQAVA
jgi:diguanylate cyclase (GGDEF)-like protein